eukprot:2831281-Pyramimonas_sp.AAC.1
MGHKTVIRKLQGSRSEGRPLPKSGFSDRGQCRSRVDCRPANGDSLSTGNIRRIFDVIFEIPCAECRRPFWPSTPGLGRSSHVMHTSACEVRGRRAAAGGRGAGMWPEERTQTVIEYVKEGSKVFGQSQQQQISKRARIPGSHPTVRISPGADVAATSAFPIGHPPCLCVTRNLTRGRRDISWLVLHFRHAEARCTRAGVTFS